MNGTQSAGLEEALLALTEPVIEELLKSICRRIKSAGAITRTAEYEIYRTEALGATKKEIEQAVARQLKLQEPVVESLFEYVLDNTVAYEDDGSLRQIAEAYAKQAQQWSDEKLHNLWAQAPNGKVLPIQDAYAKSLDFAFRQTVTGALDPEAAIRRACDGLAKRGLRTIEEKNGRTVGIEYATRRYLSVQLGDLNEEITKKNYNELGCDGWEVDAHIACAPDHEMYQGKQFSDEEFQKLQEKLDRPLGNRHYGCRHNVFGIHLGIDRPQYSDEELQKMREENERGVTFDGQHYTRYEARQEQARLENAIRHQKRKVLVAAESGDKKVVESRIRLQVMESAYSRFCDVTGLSPRYERLSAAGFSRSEENAAIWEYRSQRQSLDDAVESYYTGKGETTARPWRTWNSIQGKHTSAQDIAATNPGRGTDPAYEANCQRCVPAYEMRRRGYDVQARPAPADDALCSPQNIASMFNDVRMMRVRQGNGLKEIEQFMQLWGEGARAEVYVEMRNTGHVFVAEQRNGRTVFRDPQKGLVGCRDYFGDAVAGNTLFFRIDNAEINDLIALCCKGVDGP